MAHVKQLGRYPLGRDASHIRHFTHWAYHDFAAKRGAMDFWSAVSGLEQALWDLAGKRLGVPGGHAAGRTVPRADLASTPTAGTAAPRRRRPTRPRPRRRWPRGFTALKFDPFPGPWRTHISREAEQAGGGERCVPVREAVGPKVDLLVEVHRRLAPMHAVRIARMLEPFDPFWYEEPVSARDWARWPSAAARSGLPIVTGEELYTRFEFREVFERRAAEHHQP